MTWGRLNPDRSVLGENPSIFFCTPCLTAFSVLIDASARRMCRRHDQEMGQSPRHLWGLWIYGATQPRYQGVLPEPTLYSAAVRRDVRDPVKDSSSSLYMSRGALTMILVPKNELNVVDDAADNPDVCLSIVYQIKGLITTCGKSMLDLSNRW